MGGPAEISDAERKDAKDQRFVLTISGVLVAVGILGFGVFTLASCAPNCRWQALGAAGLLGGASFSSGSLLGLLFGIPRNSSDGESGSKDQRFLLPNNNLIEISDWLTKALVGVSLTQFYKIPTMLTSVGEHFKKDIGSGAVAIAILMHFVVSGFLSGYLLTRIILQGAFHRAAQVSPVEAKNPIPSSAVEVDPDPPPTSKPAGSASAEPEAKS